MYLSNWNFSFDNMTVITYINVLNSIRTEQYKRNFCFKIFRKFSIYISFEKVAK